MTEVEQCVRALGKAMQADERYIAFTQAKEKNDADQNLQQMIQEFNLTNLNYQREMERSSTTENSEDGKLKELEEKLTTQYNTIMANENMIAFSQAKQQMDMMMQQLDAIITLCANGEDPETCHPDLSNCTGDCGTCGGCH